MKGGRSRVLHRQGRLVHPWAPPGPREHRGRLSPGRCARRTRGGRVQPFLAVFGAQHSRAPAHLPSEFEECIARAGGVRCRGPRYTSQAHARAPRARDRSPTDADMPFSARWGPASVLMSRRVGALFSSRQQQLSGVPPACSSVQHRDVVTLCKRFALGCSNRVFGVLQRATGGRRKSV